MDWIRPYVVVALGCHAVVVLGFVAAMLVTGHRFRAVSPGAGRPDHGGAPTGPPESPESSAPPESSGPSRPAESSTPSDLSELSYEELGFLAGGAARPTEVALLRLCLSGHVEVDGPLTLVRDLEPDPESGHQSGPTVRTVLLRKLRRRGRVPLLELLAAGEREADLSGLRRRLVERGWIDPAAVRVVSARERTQAWYGVAYLLSLVAFALAGCFGVVQAGLGAQQIAGAATALGVFLAGVAVSGLAVRISGGRLSPVTPAGREVLARAKYAEPEAPDARLLHWVALRGLRTLPEFRAAEERGDPEAGTDPRTKATTAVTDLVLAIAELLAGAGGGGKR